MNEVNSEVSFSRTWRTLPALLLASGLHFAMTQASFADYERGLKALNADDLAGALREFRASAESRDARAELALGIMYARGMGIDKDAAAAAVWFKRAAEQGLAPAQLHLGVAYAEGFRQHLGHPYPQDNVLDTILGVIQA